MIPWADYIATVILAVAITAIIMIIVSIVIKGLSNGK